MFNSLLAIFYDILGMKRGALEITNTYSGFGIDEVDMWGLDKNKGKKPKKKRLESGEAGSGSCL